MRNNALNLLMFAVLAVGLYFLWDYAAKNWMPKPPDKEAEARKKIEEDAAKVAEDEKQRQAAERAREEKALAVPAAAGGFGVVPAAEARKKDEADALARLRKANERDREERLLVAAAAAGYSAVHFPPAVPPTPPALLVALGNPNFYNQVLLNTRGGGVQQVIVTRFQQSSRLGRDVKLKDDLGNLTDKPAPLYLIPGVRREREPYLANDYPLPDLRAGTVSPDAPLAEPSFTVFHYPTPDSTSPDPHLGELLWTVVSVDRPDGDDAEHKVVFEAKLDAPYFVRFVKTYTLKPREYHIGLKVEIERLPGGVKGQGQLRYQLSGPRGLPIEGEWYTSTHRVALIGWNDRKGVPRRQHETANEIAAKRGGESVPKGENTFKYMAVFTQFFTSAVAVDDTADGSARNPWAYVRATTELPFDRKQNPNMPQFDDLTVRAASDTLDLAAGEKVAHSYILYNGPSKVKLLGLLGEDRGTVDQALVDRYEKALGLRTLTDYQSPTWIGSFANAIYWTDLVVAFTNLMHGLLAVIHSVVPDWAACIVVLTILVRLVLMYPSKKQTRMSMRMMEIQKKLAPQFEALKKKYPDDFHGYNRAKMQLMLAHGVNPAAQLGGCLLLFLQMPIMMGLYFCLQESVFFRLEPLLWIDNLAAPDMSIWWGEKIPYFSSPDNIGGMLYMGPYFNVLPILAVLLMIGQQLLMLPPPTDDQSRQQRTMMKMMMFIMPLIFYKFAAGLALYFIIGSIWGLLERRLIGKPDVSDIDKPGGGKASVPLADAGPPQPKGFFGRLKEAVKERMEEMQRQADEQAKRQIRNDRPGGGGDSQGTGTNPNPRRDDRRDKKKKRKK